MDEFKRERNARHQRDYRARHPDKVLKGLWLSKSTSDLLRQAIKSQGKSMSAYVEHAVDAALEADGYHPPLPPGER